MGSVVPQSRKYKFMAMERTGFRALIAEKDDVEKTQDVPQSYGKDDDMED